MAGTEAVKGAAPGAQLLNPQSAHSAAALQDHQPDTKQSDVALKPPVVLRTTRPGGGLLIDGFIMPPGVRQALSELQDRTVAGPPSPSRSGAHQGVARIRGGAAEATSAARAAALAADEDTTASPSGSASKRPRWAAARASDGDSAQESPGRGEAGGSAGSTGPSCSESDDDEALAQKMEDLEQTVGDLTSRSTHNAARIEQMSAHVQTLASSQEALLRRMASLQQQLQERESEADTLHGALANLAGPPSPPGSRPPSPSEAETSSYTRDL